MNRVIVSFIGGLASQMNNYAFILALKRQFPDLTLKALDGCFDHNGFELGSVFGLEFDWIDRRVAQSLVISAGRSLSLHMLQTKRMLPQSRSWVGFSFNAH